MTGASSFLAGIESQGGMRAVFVGRVPGVASTREKWETLSRLEPEHRRVVREAGFSWDDLWRAEQVHGAVVEEVPGEGRDRIVAGADGLVTASAGVLLGIYVADCAAVYLADRRTGAIGLVHSGRKGTEEGIVVAAVERMGAAFGTGPEDLQAAISPCIRPPHYEIDIAAAIRRQLADAGVPGDRIADSGVCTGAEVGKYYSYRIEKGKTGRMLALLGRVREVEGKRT